jgi:hypothetical protein
LQEFVQAAVDEVQRDLKERGAMMSELKDQAAKEGEEGR